MEGKETPEAGKPEEETSTQTGLETLTTQLQKATVELEGLKKGYATVQQTLAERDREIKRRTDLESQIAGIQDTVELLATAISTKGEVENLDGTERQDILTELKKKRNEQEAKRKQEETLRSQQEYNQKADTIYSRAKAIFGDDDEAIERIEDLLIQGRQERAEARVAKAEKSKQTTSSEPEEKRIDRLADEKARKLMEEKGLLTSETGQPSASGGVITAEWLAKASKEELKARMTEIDKAYKEGKIRR